MLNLLDTDIQLQEPDSDENEAHAAALQHEQLMHNMCSDETRSLI